MHTEEHSRAQRPPITVPGLTGQPAAAPTLAAVVRQVVCLCVLVLTPLGCGSDGGGTSATTFPVGEPVRFHPEAASPPLFGDIPWPSDLYLDGTGAVGEVHGLDRLATRPASIERGLRALDGFGRSTGAIFFVDAAVDPQSLPRTWMAATAPDASVFIADVDEASPALGTRYPAFAKYLPALGCISVIPVPGIVLPPGVRHAAVLTTRALTLSGSPFVADTGLQRIATLPAAMQATAVERLYGDALDQLVAHAGVARKQDIAGLAVFTTSRQVFELGQLREQVRRQPEPELILDAAEAAPYSVAVFGIGGRPSLGDWLGTPERDEEGREWPGGDNPGGMAHDQIAVIASGAFVAPSFIDRRTPHFQRDEQSGEFILINPNATIPVTLVIPKRPAPPEGYPVVIHGHGLSNHRGSMLGVANELARAGFAMIGIDDVQHGSRGGIRDQRNNYSGPYVGPDGIPDDTPFPLAFFAGFNDFVAVRDNFRQTILDQVSLVRLIQSTKLELSALAAAAGGTTPKLDPERIYWSGGSLGGIVGAMTIAIEPEIQAAALQVPGASFIQLISTGSATVADLVAGIADANLGVRENEARDEFHPVALLLAAITEAGDPIAYAPHVFGAPGLGDWTPPAVLVTYAVWDEVLPNLATTALIRALGLPLASPHLLDVPGIATAAAPVAGNLRGGRTGAAVQYMPANHGLGYGRFDTRNFLPGVPLDGPERFPRLPREIQFEQPIREHWAQVIGFFETAARGGPARIEVTVPPRADYDGDGVLDDDERAQGTDPYDPASH